MKSSYQLNLLIYRHLEQLSGFQLSRKKYRTLWRLQMIDKSSNETHLIVFLIDIVSLSSYSWIDQEYP